MAPRMIEAEAVEVIVAHSERATLKVGSTFLKIDPDDRRLASEIASMRAAPVPTPEVLWHRRPVLAITEVPGTALARLGEPSRASADAWAATGATIRSLHEAPVPEWRGDSLVDVAERLDVEVDGILTAGLLPEALVRTNREIARRALRPHAPAFIHGDLQVAHVFIDEDRVTGIIDWSEGGWGDPMFDLGCLTLGHRDRLEDLLAGYGPGADVEAIRGWWSLRSLLNIRWLAEHGFDPGAPGAEIDVLRAQAAQV